MILFRRLGIVAVPSLLGAALVAAWLAQASLAAQRGGASTSRVTNVAVTLGAPAEYAISVSTTRVPLGTVAFRVTDRGALPHDFKVCASAAGSTTPNDCAGHSTPTIMPGQSATLEVVFAQPGTFEYLSTVPGHAKAGTGLLDVGSTAHGAEKLALAQRVAQCMHAHGFPNYPGGGNSTAGGSKPSASRANAAEQACEREARSALGLP